MSTYEVINTETVGPFIVTAKIYPEEEHVRDLFLDDEAWVASLENQIERGNRTWSSLLVTVELNGVVIADDYISGLTYDTEECNGYGGDDNVLIDGTYDSCKREALNRAWEWVCQSTSKVVDHFQSLLYLS